MVRIWKGHVHSRVLPGCKIFLKDGNRLYCEDWNHTDTVARDDEPHATENPPTSPLRINFLGCHKILFADHIAISEIGTAKNQAPVINTKGGIRAKSLGFVQQQSVKSLSHYRSMHRLIDFSCL